MKYKVIGFDADDTLWENETFYQKTEKEFVELCKIYMPEEEIPKELFKTEIKNMELYGYGAKAFVLSIIETAINISNGKITGDIIEKIITVGKALVDMPIILLDDVEIVLKALKPKYKLIVATKGDLIDQERKLRKSGLENYFDHIEVMSDKREQDYKKLLKNLRIESGEFLMIGNSLKSDVIPVLNLGAAGVHVPFHTTWLHETADDSMIKNQAYRKVEKLSEVLNFL